MLVNFRCPARQLLVQDRVRRGLCPLLAGVLIQLENLRSSTIRAIAWMDSCAAEDHPMIDSLWPERRAIVRVSVPLKGFRRRAIYTLCTGLERASAAVKGRRTPA